MTIDLADLDGVGQAELVRRGEVDRCRIGVGCHRAHRGLESDAERRRHDPRSTRRCAPQRECRPAGRSTVSPTCSKT